MIHYLTVATEEKLYLPYLKQLLPELIILGMNTKWEGFITKYRLVIKYLNELNENDIVCFMDAYDVLPTKNIINLENQFNLFMKNHKNIKMIIGYDLVDNIFLENMEQKWFGTINNDRLNSGNYIGYVKNIHRILSYILDQNPNMEDDQLEITNYAKRFPGEIYIDKGKNFFNVITKPLESIKVNDIDYEYSFIHANGNGFLNDFLYDYHNIVINPVDNINITFNHYVAFAKKCNIYMNK